MAALGLPGLLGCAPPKDPLQGDLRELVAAQSFATGRDGAAPLRFLQPPTMRAVAPGGESRQAVVTRGAWWWRGTVMSGTRLAAAMSAPPGAAAAVAVSMRRGDDPPRVLARVALGGDWAPVVVDLRPFARQRVELEVAPVDESGRPLGAEVAWAPFRFAGRAANASRPASRPNVVVVLVDTLRADHVGCYGAVRPTTPNLDALLAARGVVVERAYAQAPWTIPSVASLLSARWPGEIWSRDGESYTLPARLPVLAAELRKLGYETAGFFANPTLVRENGFARGFDTFFTPEDPRAALERLHADELTRRIRRWLDARGDGPFFLYAHYMDPHDPYQNPDDAGGRSPFDPDYRGSMAGTFVHGLYLGKLVLQDPPADVAHLSALYDDEVRYWDRSFGTLMEAFDDDLLRQTLFVVTADHGEELYDHGGWKHGRTLFEEQLRVPLVWRWDGHLPAGKRLREPARLMDVAPTLLSAAGSRAPAQWQGRDLLSWLRGGDPPPAEPLFAQHLADGPPRWAATSGRWKLLLFDRYAPFAPANELEASLYEQERERLPRAALYDLREDPQERRNLAAQRPELVGGLQSVILEHLARGQPGLHVLLAGLPPGQRVEVRVRLPGPLGEWRTVLLGAGDRVEAKGSLLTLRLLGDVLAKGVVLPSADEGVESLDVRGASLRVRLPDGLHRGGRLSGALLASTRPPRPGAGAELLIWYAPPNDDSRRETVDPETLRRLRALGYAG
jgi:arylsulfatase A-like enzyme